MHVPDPPHISPVGQTQSGGHRMNGAERRDTRVGHHSDNADSIRPEQLVRTQASEQPTQAQRPPRPIRLAPQPPRARERSQPYNFSQNEQECAYPRPHRRGRREDTETAPSAPEMIPGEQATEARWPDPTRSPPPPYEQGMEERIMREMAHRVREVLRARDALINRAMSRMEQRLADLVREELRAHMDEFHAARRERWADTTL